MWCGPETRNVAGSASVTAGRRSTAGAGLSADLRSWRRCGARPGGWSAPGRTGRPDHRLLGATLIYDLRVTAAPGGWLKWLARAARYSYPPGGERERPDAGEVIPPLAATPLPAPVAATPCGPVSLPPNHSSRSPSSSLVVMRTRRPRSRLAHRPDDRRAAHSWSRMDISTSSYQRPSCSTDSR